MPAVEVSLCFALAFLDGGGCIDMHRAACSCGRGECASRHSVCDYRRDWFWFIDFENGIPSWEFGRIVVVVEGDEVSGDALEALLLVASVPLDDALSADGFGCVDEEGVCRACGASCPDAGCGGGAGADDDGSCVRVGGDAAHGFGELRP